MDSKRREKMELNLKLTLSGQPIALYCYISPVLSVLTLIHFHFLAISRYNHFFFPFSVRSMEMSYHVHNSV